MSITGTDTWFGQPKGLTVLFLTEMWEKFSFFGMRALQIYYMIKQLHFSQADASLVYGLYAGGVYLTPIVGGYIADRWLGRRRAIIGGGLLMALGHFTLASEALFFPGLALIAIGNGLFLPNLPSQVGDLYAAGDPRRGGAYNVYYVGINLGALLAPLVCGTLGEVYGWHVGFGAAGIGMILGLLQFLWGQKYLHGHAEPPKPLARGTELKIYGVGLLCLVPVAALMWAVANHAFALGGEVSLAQLLMLLVMTGFMVWFTWYVLRECTQVQRQQMITLLVLIFMCLVYFTMYEQTYGSWVTFTDRLLTKDIMPSMVIHEGKQWPWSTVSLVMAPASFMFSAWLSDRYPRSSLPKWLFVSAFVLMMVFLARDMVSLPQNASSLTYLSGPFILALAPIFSVLWGWLDRRGMNPSKPAKSAIGLMFAGLSFIPLALAAQQAGATGAQASVWWLVLTYGVMEIGEMCLSPVGLSAVTQLSVPRVVSLMMGTWFLATAFSETLAAAFGKLAALDKELPAGGVLL
ncbi:MAG TPA: peptide MFS transporter, partial [Rhizobacter sp.]|nr:peptide MFS transporter [Rhizobacter sp.]